MIPLLERRSAGTWLVSLTLQQRAMVGLAAVLVPLWCPVAATSTAAETPASIAGQFLVASPSMEDPRFDRTVILMVRHDRDGAFGIVINRPIGERPLAELLDALGEKGARVPGTVRIAS